MSWKKHFQLVPSARKMTSALVQSSGGGGGGVASSSKFSSYLPEVYAGQPNRIERYAQYDQMDMDPEIHSALDIIADFCTQVEEREQMAFDFFYKGQPTEAEIRILNTVLRKWCDDNEWKTRLWETVRGTLKYGDQFFIRDPETYELIWVDHNKVEKVIVNEAEGKEPDTYLVRDLDLNLQNKVATAQDQNPALMGMPQFPNQGAGTLRMSGQYQGSSSGASAALGNPTDQLHTDSNITAVEAKHMVHVSMNVGNDNNWPFGTSILESVFKVFKQKELLEDALIIYRVQRAPERRVFYIDIGNMPPTRAKAYLENVKNEIHQRRIPNRTGGGSSIMDAAYNPMSIIEDYFFAQGCILLSTKIPLLDGRELTLGEIIENYNSGKELFTYTVNQKTFKMEPGKIKWAGVTRKNAELVKVTLDNNETVTCTPDHRFIMRDGSEVEAKDLKTGDSCMPIYLIDSKVSNKQKAKKPYLRYICNSDGKKKWVHTTICPKKNIGKEYEIHHIDFNNRNNNPTNLIEMSTKEHRKLHKNVGTYSLSKQWNSEDSRKKLIDGIRNYHLNRTPQDNAKLSLRNKKNGSNTFSKSYKKWYEKNLEVREKASKSQRFVVNDEIFDKFVEYYNDGYNSISKISKLKDKDDFQKLLRKYNPKINSGGSTKDKTTIKTGELFLKKIALHAGYDSWDNFKKEYKLNHKVVSVEFLNYREDTGDLTIESPSNSHNFAISAGIYIHNSEGKGSKVDTLPGGENLGEIDDLKYFDNKLKRGLGVPPSYLPSGPEEGTQSFSDGRVGTAYMQEWRFSKTCERYQDIIIRAFDDEFKLYLSESGYQIDEGLYDVVLRPPQNFSKFRQIEIDTAQIGVFSQLVEQPFWSKRFLMERFLQLDEDEILRNEQLFLEENPDIADEAMGQSAATAGGGGSGMPGLEAVGAGAGDAGGEEGMDLGGDEAGAEDAGGAESPISGAEDAGGDADAELPSA